MANEINDLRASQFLVNFMQKTFLYNGLYQIKESELRIFLEKLKISGNIEELVTLVSTTLTEYDKLPKPQKRFLDVLFGEKIRTMKDSLKLIDLFGEPLLNLAEHHFENLNYENLLEFEIINYLIFLFVELDNYIYNAFKYVLERKPHLLKDKKIDFKLQDFEFYLKNKDEDYIYSFLAEKEIERKLYGDYLDIFEFACKKLGLKHNIEYRDIRLLDAGKKIRNLYVHSDGKITSIFLMKIQRKLPKLFDYISKNYKIGEKYKINYQLIFNLQNFVFAVVKKLDKTLIKAHPEIIQLEFKKRNE